MEKLKLKKAGKPKLTPKQKKYLNDAYICIKKTGIIIEDFHGVILLHVGCNGEIGAFEANAKFVAIR